MEFTMLRTTRKGFASAQGARLSPTVTSNTHPQASPPPRSAWRRLHAVLMPDYNRQATAFWWLTVAAGTTVLLGCVIELSDAGLTVWLQLLGGMVLAMLAGLFPMRVPGSNNSFVAGEIFIFLVLLVHGPQAAAVAAAGEAAMGSYRSSKRWTSRLLSPCVAALAMQGSGWLLTEARIHWGLSGWADAPALLAAMMVFAAIYFCVVAFLIGAVLRLKREEPFFIFVDLLSVFRWVGMAYTGSAAMAALMFLAYRQAGAALLMVMLPLLAMLLVTLHFYFRQQESAQAADASHAESAAREAATAVREAEAVKAHMRELQASERRFHSAFTHASIGMALMDFDGRLLMANPALASLLGHSEAELLGHQLQEYLLADDLPLLNQQLGLAGNSEFQGFARELRCRHSQGHTVWAAFHCSFFTEPGAVSPCLIAQAQDVTSRRLAEAELQRMAFHDGLTGLPNRRRFLECLSGAVARSQADASYEFAVMFIDFDRFKLVNDSLGHSAGDELLVQLARRLQENVRPSDVLSRLGGDEFAILAERSGAPRDAIVLAERLMAALRQPFKLGEVELVSSASIGITFSSFGYDSGEAVLRDADTAMYKAKDSGKAAFALFDAGLHNAVSSRLRLEGELRRAIEDQQLSLVYQPLVELSTGRLNGFEALVRWNHPEQGVMAPSAFLSIADESGLMPELSDFVMHCACQQLRSWQRSNPALQGLTMSVNISSVDLAQAAFIGRVSRAIVEAGLNPEHLTLELSEDVLMGNIGTTQATLQQLHQLGVRLAVDDFGTGRSSLGHLSKLPIDTLKIDRSFIAQMQRDEDGSAVVRAIIHLGTLLRKTVVAEGIESADQLEQLREMGCHLGQGFHLANPLSLLAAGELLQGHAQGHSLGGLQGDPRPLH